MKSILIIVFILMVIAVAGIIFFLAKKNKSSSGAPNLANKRQSGAPQKPIAQSQPQTSVTGLGAEDAAKNTLSTAQMYINQQRYDEAEVELKKGLLSKPNDKDLSLKLLNLFMSTNNRSEFDNLFLKIQDGGDPAVTQEALRLMSLMDEETIRNTTAIAQQQHAQVSPNQAHSIDNSSLDFNDAPSHSPDDTSLDFPNFDTTVVEKEDKSLTFDTISNDSPVPDTSSGLSFDNTTASKPTNNINDLSVDGFGESKSQAVSTDDDFGGLSLDATPTPNNDMGLDFNTSPVAEENDPFSSLSLNQQTSNTSGTTDDVNLDFNTSLDNSESSFDLSLDTEKSVQKKSQTADESNNIDPFADLQLSNNNVASHAVDNDFTGGDFTSENNVVTNTPADAGLEFTLQEDTVQSTDTIDGIDFGLKSTTPSATATPTENTDPFNFDDFNTTTASQPEISTKPLADLADTSQEQSFDAFNLNDVEDNTFTDSMLDNGAALAASGITAGAAVLSSTTPKKPELDFNVDSLNEQAPAITNVDEFASLDVVDTEIVAEIAPIITEQPAVAPMQTLNAATPVLETAHATTQTIRSDVASESLDFVNDLDSNAITLDLATQYFELGEYDSAQRLLDEVILSGNETQIQQANNLLAQVG